MTCNVCQNERMLCVRWDWLKLLNGNRNTGSLTLSASAQPIHKWHFQETIHPLGIISRRKRIPLFRNNYRTPRAITEMRTSSWRFPQQHAQDRKASDMRWEIKFYFSHRKQTSGQATHYHEKKLYINCHGSDVRCERVLLKIAQNANYNYLGRLGDSLCTHKRLHRK